jgi:hypothetical protein
VVENPALGGLEDVGHCRPLQHIPNGDGILAPNMHLHRECAGRVLEDLMGLSEVEWATPSGIHEGADGDAIVYRVLVAWEEASEWVA